jgi:hypothetical protein
LFKLEDAFTLLLDCFLILGQLSTHALKESTRSANSECFGYFLRRYGTSPTLVPDTTHVACRL